MPKGPPPQWTSRDCRFDHLVGAAVNVGFGNDLFYRGIGTPERAKDIKTGIYRCARHRGISVRVEWQHESQWTAVTKDWPPDREPDGTITLKYVIYTKAQARRSHIARYGTDRQQWPYNPRAAKSQADIDAWADRGLDEKGHRVR
jgi:hypothetical protein